MNYLRIRLPPLWACLAAMLCVLAVLIPTACPAAGPPIVIGGTLSFEGKYRAPSLVINEALKLWEGQVNQQGGLLGRPVKLVIYDDQSDAGQVKILYQRLLDQDKADLLLTPYSSQLTLAALEISEPRHRLMIGSTAAGDEIWDQGSRYIFGVYAPASRYFIGVLDLLARHGLKEVALVNEKSSFPAEAARGAREWALRLGLNIKQQFTYDQAVQEMPAILEQVKASGAQALILCAYPDDCYLLLEHLAKLDWRPRVLAMSVGPAQAEFGQKAGAGAEGVLGPSQWEPNLRIPYPGSARFINDFRQAAHREPTYHAASAYAGLSLAAKAVEHTGSLDNEKLRLFIWSLDTVTLMGHFKVDATGKQIGHSPLIIQWQDGVKQIVYPPKMQTAEPRL